MPEVSRSFCFAPVTLEVGQLAGAVEEAARLTFGGAPLSLYVSRTDHLAGGRRASDAGDTSALLHGIRSLGQEGDPEVMLRWRGDSAPLLTAVLHTNEGHLDVAVSAYGMAPLRAFHDALVRALPLREHGANAHGQTPAVSPAPRRARGSRWRSWFGAGARLAAAAASAIRRRR